METKKIDTDMLSDECWTIQMWGKESCFVCEFYGTKECSGKKIIKTGKNKKGFEMPIQGEAL